MKKLIILLIVVGMPYFGYTKWIKGDASTVTFDSEQIVITTGDNTYYATEESEYDAQLRVYGIQNGSASGGWSPIGHATHMLMALPVQQMDAKDVCEKNAVSKATCINFHVQDDELKKRLADLEAVEGRRCVWVAGTKMHIDEFHYKDEDHTSSLTRQGKFDPRFVILMSDIEMISCD